MTNDGGMLTNVAETIKGSSKPTWLSSLFKGMNFVLTQGTRPAPVEESNKDLNTSLTSALESETEPEPDVAGTSSSSQFVRSALSKTITDNGGKSVRPFLSTLYKTNVVCTFLHSGTVLSEFPGAKSPILAGLIVVSDRHCSTMTYLLGVAYKFKILSHLWVSQCVSEQKILPSESYLLPVGYSKIEKRTIEQAERNVNLKNTKKDLFTDLHLLLTSKRHEFGADWKPLLARLGASVSFRSQGKIIYP